MQVSYLVHAHTDWESLWVDGGFPVSESVTAGAGFLQEPVLVLIFTAEFVATA